MIDIYQSPNLSSLMPNTFIQQVRCHIVHLSASKALPMIREAQARGVPLSVETCHHYLSFAAEDILDNATQYKCCPPIREGENQVREGTREKHRKHSVVFI